MRQEDLARRLDVPQSFVSKIESGERRLDVMELRVICAALGISAAHFLEELEREIGDE